MTSWLPAWIWVWPHTESRSVDHPDSSDTPAMPITVVLRELYVTVDVAVWSETEGVPESTPAGAVMVSE